MSGRCKACNAKLEDWEMVAKYPGTNEYKEICTLCEIEEDLLTEEDDEFYLEPFLENLEYNEDR